MALKLVRSRAARLRWPCVVAALLAAASANAPAVAQRLPSGPVQVIGVGLEITPHRLVLSPGEIGEVVLSNRSATPSTFAVGVIDRVMQPDGRLLTRRELTTPAQKARGAAMRSAARYLRADATEVVLPAGESRPLRLQADPATPPGAELHSHLSFRAVPPEGAPAGAVALNVSIAVFVRSGPVESAARLDNPQIRFRTVRRPGAAAKVTPVLSVDLVRLGPSSLFGGLEVRSIGSIRPPLGQITSLAVYPEIPRRRVDIPLVRTPNPGERLQVRFIDADARPGAVLATTEVRVDLGQEPRPGESPQVASAGERDG